MLAKLKKKYIGDWDFYKKYLLLAIPMILQNAITNLVSFLDNIMVGQLGTEQMSGVAIVNQLIFVYNLAIFGAVSAASIFGAQYFGKGNHKGHMYSFRFKLYATLLVTGGAILLFLTKGSALISLYLTDTVGNGATDLALQYGLEYLAIMMVGLIPFAVNQSYATNIKETGQTFIPMLASFVAVGTNAILDYLMIFGIGPFPELGVQGAALATVIARYIEALIVVIWAHIHRGKNRYLEGAYTGFGIPLAELKAILIKGFPLMMNEVVISFKFIGKKFTGYSCLMIVVSGILTDMVPAWPVTEDILLIAIFGGLINALAISLCLFANATSGGTDFIAIFLSEKYSIDSWNYIFAGNVVILGIAGALFGWDKALYSIIFQYTSTQVLHVLYKRYQKQTLIIVTKRPEDVYEAIAEITHHDATLIKGEGCYSKQECDVLYSVVGRDEVSKVVNTVRETDPQAFVNMIRTENLAGRFYQRPND